MRVGRVTYSDPFCARRPRLRGSTLPEEVGPISLKVGHWPDLAGNAGHCQPRAYSLTRFASSRYQLPSDDFHLSLHKRSTRLTLIGARGRAEQCDGERKMSWGTERGANSETASRRSCAHRELRYTLTVTMERFRRAARLPKDLPEGTDRISLEIAWPVRFAGVVAALLPSLAKG